MAKKPVESNKAQAQQDALAEAEAQERQHAIQQRERLKSLVLGICAGIAGWRVQTLLTGKSTPVSIWGKEPGLPAEVTFCTVAALLAVRICPVVYIFLLE